MNNDDNLDLLDLDDNTSMDALPEAAPFVTPRPKKPWLLLGIGVVVIILATYIIVRTIGSDSSSGMDVDLDVPAVVVDAPGDVIDVPVASVSAEPVNVAPVAPAPVAQPAPVAPAPTVSVNDVGTPVRVVEDRKPVTFNPDRPAPAPKKAAPAPKPAVKSAPKPKAAPAPKPVAKKQAAPVNGGWYVQFGSYSTRALAESAGRKLKSSHPALFEGKQFVVLAAVMKDGSTLYRLRIAFSTSAQANGFCRNAKSDGLDCYVAK